MRLELPAKAGSVLAGLIVAFTAASTFLVFMIGDFQQGREATLLMGVFLALLSATLLIRPFLPRVGSVVGVLTLLYLAAVLLVAAFAPELDADNPWLYQVAGISLVVLLLARIALSFRRRVKQGHTQQIS